jgi:hypothetical protein
MSSEEEAAKALSKVAEFGTRALPTVEKVGGYLATVFGALPENLIGLAGDWVHHMRVRNWARLGEKTEAILKRRGITADVDDLSPSIAVPLLSAAVDETRSELQELWAKLLANAMDPKRATIIRREFIDTLRLMNPLDALVLDLATGHPPMEGDLVNASDFPERLKVSADEMAITIVHLHRLGCIAQTMNAHGVQHPPEFATRLRMSPYARALMQACRA